ncbi:hypothetical protein L2E82_00871 [Cichorium intybus]|uniref:Uncharacterized protein n=1 Tax=Cichorium intybus TaxID=13427 RepID=A0ACB9GYK7_CICIN|nr:hypothetical protein L2E82_00871 [Cichorium intybus]
MEQYRIIEKIGSGSYGIVFGALNEHTGEKVAIKKLKIMCKSVNDCTNMREIKALCKMNHPNIVRLKQIIKEHDTLYLVLEYMECNLYQRMIGRNPFSEDEIRQLCFQMFQGLAYMHRNGYFHRDLKPENFLVSKDIIKIADLGLARETNGKPPYTDNVGSRWYQAPEVLLHAEQHDSSVDMWAMGAIMAELFTSQPLFPGDYGADQIYNICNVIGSPTESTWSEGLQLARNLNYHFPQLPGVQLSSIVPSASPDALNLIAALLSWSPWARPTAMEALEHPFFSTCYNVPPPLRGQTLPELFKMVMKWEFEMEMESALLKQTTKSPTSGSEKVDSTEDPIRGLLETPFFGSERVDSTEDLIRLLPKNPFY